MLLTFLQWVAVNLYRNQKEMTIVRDKYQVKCWITWQDWSLKSGLQKNEIKEKYPHLKKDLFD